MNHWQYHVFLILLEIPMIGGMKPLGIRAISAQGRGEMALECTKAILAIFEEYVIAARVTAPLKRS